MPRAGRPWSVFGLLARSLRMRLALLYAALFCVSAIALAAVAVIFKPNFLVRSGYQEAPRTPKHAILCCQHTGPSFVATITHDMGQNLAGVALAGVMVLLAVGVGWLLAGRVLRPLRGIISSAQSVSTSNLHQRVALAGPRNEFTELAQTLDNLFGRLEASFEAQRRFVANASHELRTPLAAGRTLLQVALADPGADPGTLRAACQEVLDLGQQQERLIGALLTLASSETGIEHWRPIDLAEIAEEVVSVRRADAERRGVHVSAALSAAPVTGDASLTESLIANLVDNALRHNLPGGTMDIATAIADGRAVLTVSNTGRPVPAGEVDRLFQPFQRLGTDRVPAAGYGLGLAIVRAIAAAHGAALAAGARPGGGLDIEVSFP
jgi:signal transduction histidine kinase